MGILEKIQEIEREIARTQKNKATEYHLGLLKAKLARYRSQLLEAPKSSGAKGEGFDVMKSGDARVALVGFPSVGKSTLLNKLTSTHSETASYEFTTLTCIPGVIEQRSVYWKYLSYKCGLVNAYLCGRCFTQKKAKLMSLYAAHRYCDANIQLLDLPGIIEGASEGKGKGRQVIAVARTADMILMMLDATKGDMQRFLLEKELLTMGIRLNKKTPNIYFKRRKGGGLSINSMVRLTKIDEKMVQMILHDYKIFNAEVIFREDGTADDLIDVIEGNRVYLKCLYVYNKIDQVSMEEVDRLARQPNSVVISCGMGLNLGYLLDQIWQTLSLIRVYTKKRGEPPDFTDALIMRSGCTVEHCCHSIHRTLVEQFKYALVWGTSVKYSPQRVGIQHQLNDEDVIQIMKK